MGTRRADSLRCRGDPHRLRILENATHLCWLRLRPHIDQELGIRQE